ncbi:hypothetical protein [Aureimonas phyllosphaerae]|uniref:Uncharacterized protein n=1 Tax=Aureimonas phyllosphaerae TaxID=1166078 RepID=A0A7W6C2P7_9HYPH|nr:hypothetical protein [Aureimonas phyllosphaerae]MBB3937362.1 hypothetical protein [Aureimonas phyllosphaerae]MBB3961369.1 hypothetical protein [Aureimonas phyllosphaerae]SFF42315.1 hypothetical protein SAMN05216566_11280 [Aureimonas phyllosphaerae]
MLRTAILAFVVLATGTARAEDDEIYYGSRAGMSVTTVSKAGIGTSMAVIRVEHRPRNAKAFYVDYVLDNSMACVRKTMASVKVRDRVTADCRKRTWTDLYGERFAFLGRQKDRDSMADYVVKRLDTGEVLDGSSASGYPTALGIFQVLCPGIAK